MTLKIGTLPCVVVSLISEYGAIRNKELEPVRNSEYLSEIIFMILAGYFNVCSETLLVQSLPSRYAVFHT